MTSIFFQIDRIVNVCSLIVQKHHFGFFKNYPIRKSNIFGTLKCVLRRMDLPTLGDKSALKERNTLTEL